MSNDIDNKPVMPDFVRGEWIKWLKNLTKNKSNPTNLEERLQDTQSWFDKVFPKKYTASKSKYSSLTNTK